MRNYLPALIVALALTGCADKNGGSVNSVSRDHFNQMGALGASNEWDGGDKPITAETRFAAGQLAETQGTVVRAIEQYKESLRLDPHFQPAMYRLAVTYTVAKQYTLACETWQKYIDETKGDANAYSNLGFCQELAGNYDQAEEAYLRGIAKQPTNRACRTNYGLMLARHGRIKEAREHLDVVLNAAEVHYNLGSVYEQQGSKQQARQEFREALRLDPRFQEARLRLAALE